MRFEIQNNQLSRFLRTNYALMIGLLGFMSLFLPISIMLAEDARVSTIWTVVGIFATVLILGYALMAWMVRAFTQSLSYEAKNGILYINEGFVVYRRKSIPLDRVTDFRLVQGLLMRTFGIWKIEVQTAGANGAGGAEGVLWAVQGPLATRDTLLQLRDAAVKAQRIDAAA